MRLEGEKLKVMGAIFAGGLARRFGSDKAAARIGDATMLDQVAARLAGQCDEVVVVGREWPGLRSVADQPRPGLGPLGALAGALCFAAEQGHDAVLTSGCDLPDLPPDLGERLRPAPAVVAGQPLLGLWPTELARALVDWLLAGHDRAMRSWIAHVGARGVALPIPPSNINTTEELERFLKNRP
jgi:molybdopterin-guanine dinucleotide biosynthesis protein A